MSITAFSFGEWLPDLPDLGNPGLTEALNVLPYDGAYNPFLPLLAISGGTLPAQPCGVIYPITGVVTTSATITNVTDGLVGSTPIRTITTSASHGVVAGDTIVVTGVVATGTFQINGVWSVISAPTSSTIRIAGSGDPQGAYSSGGSLTKTYTASMIAGTTTDLYAFESGAWTKRSASTYAAATSWEFAKFNAYIMGVNGVSSPQVQLSGGSNFLALATSGSAPVSAVIGVVNQFVMLGNTSDGEYYVQWGAIADPRNWPSPNSATAIATQAGRQALPSELGAVNAIHGTDQSGVILQKSGVTRLTYAGPPVVFQFDTISKTHGALFKHGSIQINGLVYFWSSQGAHVTDGVTVVPIGDGKVDRYFLDNVSPGQYDLVRPAHNKTKGIIYWAWPDLTAAAGQTNNVIAYSYEEKRWAHATQVADLIFTPAATESILEPWGFDTNHCLATFTGTPGTAIVISGEVEPQPGGCALVNGIKPIVASVGTAPSITVQVGSRDDQSAVVSYASTTTPTSRTGFADFRSDARFHRARVYIAGNFDKALGLEIDATPTGGM